MPESHLEAPDAARKTLQNVLPKIMTSAKNVHDVLACISLSFDAEENAMQVLSLRIMTHILESSVIRFHLGQSILLDPYLQSAELFQFLGPCEATSEGERQWCHWRPAQKAAFALKTIVARGHPQKSLPS